MGNWKCVKRGVSILSLMWQKLRRARKTTEGKMYLLPFIHKLFLAACKNEKKSLCLVLVHLKNKVHQHSTGENLRNSRDLTCRIITMSRRLFQRDRQTMWLSVWCGLRKKISYLLSFFTEIHSLTLQSDEMGLDR